MILLSLLCICSAAWSICWPEYLSRRQIAEFEEEFSGLLTQLRRDSVGQLEAPVQSALPVETATSPAPGKRETLNFQYRPAKSSSPAEKKLALTEAPLRVNSADADALKKNGRLPSVLAYRLVRYRGELGGFYSVEQLREVYEMTDSIYALILPFVVWDSMPLTLIDVNTAGSEKLMEHPYIHKGLAAQIVNYREKVSGYSRAEDLLKLYFMDEALLSRLRPYLKF